MGHRDLLKGSKWLRGRDRGWEKRPCRGSNLGCQVEKSQQRSRVLMQHISADAARRLMGYVFGPASGDLVQRRSQAARMDPRYEMIGDMSLVRSRVRSPHPAFFQQANPFGMERVLHEGIGLVVALAESGEWMMWGSGGQNWSW